MPMALPDTKLARIQAMRSIVGDNRPLLSQQTATEALLEDMVPDWNLERQRINEDKAVFSPEGDALSVLFGLEKLWRDLTGRGDDQRAAIVQQMIMARLSVLQQQLAGGTQRTQGIQAQREAQGTRVTEPSPQMLPAEAGGVRPEALAGNRAVTTLLEKRARAMGVAEPAQAEAG